MNKLNFEKFEMSGAGYIYVSKKTRKVHAIEVADNDIQLVSKANAEMHFLIKGLLLTGLLYHKHEFYSLMEYVDKYEDPFVYDALLAFRECCHNSKFDSATKIYID